MIFYIVNAFTRDIFGGNTAGVVIYDSLHSETMQKIASELRFSETAFIKIINKRTFEIRYFTPTAEVDLCGHATIASFEALSHLEILDNSKCYTIIAKAETLKVIAEENYFYMQQSKPSLDAIIKDYSELTSILGIDASTIGDVNYRLMPQIASTGLKDIILPLKSSEALNRINPDFEKLALYSRKHDVVGLHAFTLDIKGYTALCRNFAPLYGIKEEAATGTSNGALTFYLLNNSVLESKSENIEYLQGVTMGRPSVIKARITGDESTCIHIGGSGRILSKGNLFL